MKKIELKETKIPQGGDKPNLTYKDLIEVCMNNVPKEGWNTAEMRKRNRIWDELEAVTPEAKEIQLEDADFAVLKNLVLTTIWGINHRDLVAFEDYINAIQ